MLAAGCDRQRDLYVLADTLLDIKGDWVPSLGRSDMSMDATAVAYSEGGAHLYAKEYFFEPHEATIEAEPGEYGVMIFNGLMYAEDDTHLDGVFFRGTDDFDTFEAVAAEATATPRRLSRAEGEYIATNNMEIFTSMAGRIEIDSDGGYHKKYEDGKDTGDIPGGGSELELLMIPQAMSYPAKVTVEITNISSAYGADAAVYGFAGSAFAADRMPSHFLVTHQFNLNGKTMTDTDTDTGTISSPEFVTFGPPVDMPDNTYSVYLRIVLVDGITYETTVDITDQVLPFIEKVRVNIEETGPPEYGLTLPIFIELTLPEVEPIEGIIGIGEWDDDEVIRVPVNPS